MDVLVSLGTNASYVYSLLSILFHHFSNHHMSGDYQPTDFFETAAMLITFIILGKYLEASAKGKTSAAITKLLTLTPASAVLVTLGKTGEVAAEQEVPTALIHRGDVLKVLPLGCPLARRDSDCLPCSWLAGMASGAPSCMVQSAPCSLSTLQTLIACCRRVTALVKNAEQALPTCTCVLSLSAHPNGSPGCLWGRCSQALASRWMGR